MIGDIVTIALKEILEIRSSGKKLILFLVYLIPAFVISYSNGYESLLPMNLTPYYVLGIISAGSAVQLVFDSILSEKKSKTLDVLLASGITKLSIVVGKIIPSCVISFIFTIISMFIIKYNSTFNLKINVLLLLDFVLVAYLSACITIALTIIVSDEKIAPAFVIFTTVGIFVAIGYGLNKLKLPFNSIGLLFLLLCIIITFLTIQLLKKVNIITRL
jgi:ABC-type Na+ efflux pump permease subunit